MAHDLTIIAAPSPTITYQFRRASSDGVPAAASPDRCVSGPSAAPLTVTVALSRPPRATSTPWTALSCEQCPNCPLRGERACPAAADLEPVVAALGDLASYDRVDVVVLQAQRETRQRVTGEAAARAVVGLLMATSACPIVSRLRPLAHLHLPFATAEETMFRFAALHLLQAYFSRPPAAGETADAGAAPSLGALQALLAELNAVNRAFASRMRAACSHDAIPNALTALFSLSLIVSDEADDGLAGLRALFAGDDTTT